MTVGETYTHTTHDDTQPLPLSELRARLAQKGIVDPREALSRDVEWSAATSGVGDTAVTVSGECAVEFPN